MPLTIPAFDQYQSPMFPLRGLWNAKPPEGDKFVNAEIDWLVTTKSNAVQFSLSGNSPVSLSQIVALYVDNGRSGTDVDFIFPDSGFVLTVPAHNQGLFPVLSNALMFYASAPSAAAGDVTIVQVLNSMPPPIPIVASTLQNHVGLAGITIANGSTPLVAPSINGTLNTISIVVAATAPGGLQVELVDHAGAGALVWVGYVSASAIGTIPINVSGLNVRFFGGLNLVQVGVSGGITGAVYPNVYYSTP